MRSYIGITGFSNDKEISYLLNQIPDNSNCKFMCGVLLSNNKIQHNNVLTLKVDYAVNSMIYIIYFARIIYGEHLN